MLLCSSTSISFSIRNRPVSSRREDSILRLVSLLLIPSISLLPSCSRFSLCSTISQSWSRSPRCNGYSFTIHADQCCHFRVRSPRRTRVFDLASFFFWPFISLTISIRSSKLTSTISFDSLTFLISFRFFMSIGTVIRTESSQSPELEARWNELSNQRRILTLPSALKNRLEENRRS